MSLARLDTGLMRPENPMLRLPTEEFWLEWTGEAEAAHPGRRLGVLASASPGGRSGTLLSFWQRSDGTAALSPAFIDFDLDAPFPDRNAWRLRHRSLGHLDALFAHAAVSFDPAWLRSVVGDSGQVDRLRGAAEEIWYSLPVVLGFCAMLNGRNIVDQRPSDLGRLNRARVKRGRLPILEHIEVRMAIGPSRPKVAHSSSSRSMPRLHLVRGHMVHRDGRIFWRSAHFRGDPARQIRTRTVTVRAGAGDRNFTQDNCPASRSASGPAVR